MTDNTDTETLKSLAAPLERATGVEAVAVHIRDRSWIELVADRPLRGQALREIANHSCGIDETARQNGLLMATVVFAAEPLE